MGGPSLIENNFQLFSILACHGHTSHRFSSPFCKCLQLFVILSTLVQKTEKNAHRSLYSTPQHTTTHYTILTTPPTHHTPHHTTPQRTTAAFCVLEPGPACHLYLLIELYSLTQLAEARAQRRLIDVRPDVIFTWPQK